MVARELQHAPRDPRGFLRGLPEPWVISETGVRGCLTPTPLAECLAELPCFCSARRTPKFWQRVPVGDRNSSGLVLLRVGNSFFYAGFGQISIASAVSNYFTQMISDFRQYILDFSEVLVYKIG